MNSKRKILYKAITFVVFLILLLMMLSCTSFNKCAKKFGTGDTLYLTVKDTALAPAEFITEADSLSGEFDIESFLMDSINTLIHKSASDNLTIKIWYDKTDKLRKLLKYRADVKPDTIKEIIEVPVEVQIPCPSAVVADPEKALSAREKLWKKFQFFSAWLVLAGVCLTVFLLTVKKLLK